MPVAEFTPELAQVGALLRARTKDDLGNELGTFNEDTRPTGTQVQDLIEFAVGRVRSRLGEDLPEDLHESATELAAIRAAMHVELSHFPEQIGTDTSLYDRLKALWDEGWPEFLENVARTGADSESGSLDDLSAGLPAYAFPEDRGGLVTWGTVM